MSTRPDLIPEYISTALAELQDHVGPFPFEDVVRTIEVDLGRPLATIFAEFAPVPMASASVAQVHKARLPDGRIVAVKVRRPDVVEICTFDMAVMRQWARADRPHPVGLDAVADRPLEEFGRAIFAQLDFRIEAAEQPPLPRQLQGHPDVVFPEVVEALSSERVLTMSYIRGRRSWRRPRRARIPSGWRASGWHADEDDLRGRLRARRSAPREHLHHPRRQAGAAGSGPGGRARRAAPQGVLPLLRRLGAARRRRDGPHHVRISPSPPAPAGDPEAFER